MKRLFGGRLSCEKIKPIGSQGKPDWTQQTQRFSRKRRNGYKTGQFIVGQFEKGYCIGKVNNIRCERLNNQSVVFGEYKGMKVKKSGYADGLRIEGRIPDRWVVVE